MSNDGTAPHRDDFVVVSDSDSESFISVPPDAAKCQASISSAPHPLRELSELARVALLGLFMHELKQATSSPSSFTQDFANEFLLAVARALAEPADSAAPDAEAAARHLDFLAREIVETESSGAAQAAELVEVLGAELALSVLMALVGRLLCQGMYHARTRLVVRRVSNCLGIRWCRVVLLEDGLGLQLWRLSQPAAAAQAEGKQRVLASWSRWAAVGMAALTGGFVVGLSGGLAVPAVGSALGAVAGSLGSATAMQLAAFVGTPTGGYFLTSLFGAAGAGLSSSRMCHRTACVTHFQFRNISQMLRTQPAADALHDGPSEAAEDGGGLHVTIAVSGWITKESHYIKPWEVLARAGGECFAIEWEPTELMQLGLTLKDTITSEVATQVTTALLQQTALSTVMTALVWPGALLKMSNIVDNSWSVAKGRADKAGEILAQVLASRTQGCRPVRLIGYSMGARLIFRCLEALAVRAQTDARVLDIVEDVYLLGTPVRSSVAKWSAVRTVVAGRLINAYSQSDWVLRFIYRTEPSAMTQADDVAGLAPVLAEGVANIDLTGIVDGHLSYKDKMEDVIGELDIDGFDLITALQAFPVDEAGETPTQNGP